MHLVESNMNRISPKYIIAILLSVMMQFDTEAQTLLTEQAWADSIYSAMTDDERIGQLFMVRAASKGDAKETARIKREIRDYHIGGICFFQGDPREEARITNIYQDESKIPLMTAIDGEWGLGMRFPDKTISFPRQLMLGAIQDNNLIYEMGKEVGRHCQRIGLHVNFAPVADVNNNPENPVINNRSFGEDKYNVTAKSYSYMKGMQDQGIVACAKHFPGHGDTDVDSHLDLPIIAHDMNRLDSLELMPFESLSKYGIKSMMAAHLHVPAIDNRKNRPTSLSKTALTDILRDEIGFDGIIFTDAMEMKGVTKHFKAGQAEAEALEAGNDVIVLSTDIKKAVKYIKEYIASGKIEMNQVEASVKRILLEKYRLGLYQKPEKLVLENIAEDLNTKESLALKSRLIEEALTLVNDSENQIPISTPAQKIIMTLTIGATEETPFQSRINSYANAKHYFSSKKIDVVKAKALDANFENAQTVIVSFHDMSKYASKGFGIDPSAVQYVRELAKRKRVIITIFGSPYSLRYFEGMDPILVAYDEDPMTQDLAAQALFGANRISGKLPVSGSDNFPFGMGVYRESNGSLGYSSPERVGLMSDTLERIDALVDDMIKRNAAPGCQVFVAKDGKVIYDKAFGHFTQQKKRKVRKNDIYDVASVTKIMASTLSLMKLYDEGKFDPSAKLKTYLPEADTCNKGDICIHDMLAHQGKLAGWIPFYKKTMTDAKYPKPLSKYYRTTPQDSFSIKITDDMYMWDEYVDSIWSRIYASDLRENDSYRYSDLAFYFMHRTVDNLTNTRLDTFAQRNFYQPLGLRRTGFLPLDRFASTEIAPSEKDNYFRKTKLQGTVHDMGAAMLGGVSGHAGLFSTSKEIGVMMQMLLNGGMYGGRRYIDSQTIDKFTTRFHKSKRRGIGFDMKQLDPDKKLNMSEQASESTFGHLGFTGCAAWADPEENIVYVFLSNRTYPSMKNNKLGKYNYRPRIQTVIYNAIKKDAVKPLRVQPELKSADPE